MRTETTRFKVGLVAVKRISSDRHGAGWELRWQAEGRDVKRRIFGLSRDEAATMAEQMTRETYCGRGYLPGMKAPTIEKAIAAAVRLSRANAETRADMAFRASLFVRWLADRYPAVKTWDRLRPSMIQEYANELNADGQAFDSVRLRLAPIRTAWRIMAENHPELVRPLPKLNLPARSRRELACLEPAETAALLDWLKATAPDLWAMGTLQALCGLRMKEAQALRWQDVDWEESTITVANTEHHKVKTHESARTIPAPAEVMEALRVTSGGQRVKPITGELFPQRKRMRLSGRWAYFLRRAADELGNPRYREIPSKRLRSFFATLAGQLDCSDRLVKAYMGHVPGDVLGRHYRRIGLDELRAVSGVIDGWRNPAILEPNRKDSGNGKAAAGAES